MSDLDIVRRYHDGTKHHFHQFARSLGYLDWASQPAPFRTYLGAQRIPLYPRPDALASPPSHSSRIGDLLRHALGLSAWKNFRGSRWSLRVNPSSGNLHPTAAYVVVGPSAGLSSDAAVFHYSPDRHELELRCEFARAAWDAAGHDRDVLALVALTSIHWREAWKYGERAFRYCQHDLGHAVGALSIAAAMNGLHARAIPEWSHEDIATLTGIDRDEDFVEAEREEPECVLEIRAGEDGTTPSPGPARRGWPGRRDTMVAALRAGRWIGKASQLSQDHVQWTFIDEVAVATRDRGRPEARLTGRPSPADAQFSRPLVLQRRSAVAFDGRSSISREQFATMLAQVMPSSSVPWDAVWWTPRIHLALFVHRVDGIDPGLYVLPRRDGMVEALRAAFRPEFTWDRVEIGPPLWCLARGDCRGLGARLSCDQAIAGDGFFSLGMLAEFRESLAEHGASFYRHLFWESGLVGQVLYLAAEAAGARATGIGCYYDDGVHEALGVNDDVFQSLYHFTAGMPVDDARLTTETGYEWEAGL